MMHFASNTRNIDFTTRNCVFKTRDNAFKMMNFAGKCGRNMSYSCSWPAALGNNESAKPFAAMTADGCNLWRNWHDIGCGWGSVSSIIDHWGTWGPSMAASGGLLKGATAAGGGAWHDMDMLVIGNYNAHTGGNCLTFAE